MINSLKSTIMNIKLTSVFFFLVFYFQYSQAQTNLKIGHVNIQEIVQGHPAADSIKLILEVETKEMETLYNEMIIEHDAKLGVFEKEKLGYSQFVRNSKEKELMEMAQKIQAYNQTAQQQLQRRNMELVKPIYDQINSLIEQISKQNNFTYILEMSNGAIAFAAPTSENITPLIVEKLKNK